MAELLPDDLYLASDLAWLIHNFSPSHEVTKQLTTEQMVSS